MGGPWTVVVLVGRRATLSEGQGDKVASEQDAKGTMITAGVSW